MTQEEVLSLMRSSNTKAEWNANCDKVKRARNGGYPPYWFKEIIQARLCDELFGAGPGDIKIITE